MEIQGKKKKIKGEENGSGNGQVLVKSQLSSGRAQQKIYSAIIDKVLVTDCE